MEELVPIFSTQQLNPNLLTLTQASMICKARVIPL